MIRRSPEIRANFLVLMLTQRCNLSCAYCYAAAEQTGADLDPDLAFRAVQACRPQPLSDRPGRLTVELTGGEPLLIFDRLRDLVDRINTLEPRPRLAIQTNGLLLTEDKLNFLIRNRVGLGLSLDGPPLVNDRLRGGGDRAVRALDLLDRAGVGVNITVVLTRRNITDLPDFLLFCAGRSSIRVINLDLVRDLGRAGDRDLTPTADQIREIVPRLITTLAFINARRFPPLKVREIDQVARRRSEKEIQPYCLAAMGLAAAVDPKGRLWPCISLAGRPGLAAGTVDEPRPDRLAGRDRMWSLPEECRSCPTVKICRGGCPSRRVAETGRPDQPSLSECLLRLQLFHHLERQ